MQHDPGSLAAIIAFLVAIMVLARACADEGLFEAMGGHLEVSSLGSRTRLLGLSVGLAAMVTAVLSLDATVVLLTPVLLAASSGPGRSHAFASVRLANSGSLLLPVSNLTNLLVFSASGLSFIGFAWVMLPVWVTAIACEYAVLRYWFRAETGAQHVQPVTEPVPLPLFPFAVMLVVLFGLANGTTPAIAAGAGGILVGGYALVRRRTSWHALLAAANLPFAFVVFVWMLVASWLGTTVLGDWFAEFIPTGPGLVSLVGTALIAMVCANIINNLSATLLLAPAAIIAGPAAVLALLIGVNVGANLTAIGSLANLLWRRTNPGVITSWRTFHAMGLLTTPLIVSVCTVVLWGWTQIVW